MTALEAKRHADALIAAANAKAKARLDADKEASDIARKNSVSRNAAAKACKVPR